MAAPIATWIDAPAGMGQPPRWVSWVATRGMMGAAGSTRKSSSTASGISAGSLVHRASHRLPYLPVPGEVPDGA